jgi:LPS-assembly lipoprotein
MSWSRFAPLLLVLLAAACGFRPLYGDQGVSEQAFYDIEIAPINGRIGQILRNHLIDRLRPGSSYVRSSKYTLNVNLAKSKEGVAIARDEAATRFNVTLTANFVLRDNAASSDVLKGTVRSVAVYNVVQSDYATLVAEREAQSRASRDISDELRTRLATFLSRNE